MFRPLCSLFSAASDQILHPSGKRQSVLPVNQAEDATKEDLPEDSPKLSKARHKKEGWEVLLHLDLPGKVFAKVSLDS